MASKKMGNRSSNKGLADAIFEGLIGGMIKVLAEFFFKFGVVIVIIVAIIYFIFR